AHEAFLQLLKIENVTWQNRAHFFAVAARIMRHVLVDIARSRHGLQVSLDEAVPVGQERSRDLVALDDALEALAAFDRRKSRIVELRFFGGLSVEETAAVLGVSTRTVNREWNVAQAWLYRELGGGHQDES
ncbi:MAG: ECF-type sigma factor, partial [Blastocatellia bacterium]